MENLTQVLMSVFHWSCQWMSDGPHTCPGNGAGAQLLLLHHPTVRALVLLAPQYATVPGKHFAKDRKNWLFLHLLSVARGSIRVLLKRRKCMDMKIRWEDKTCLHQASSSLRYYRCPIKRKRLCNERSLPTKPAATRVCQEKRLSRECLTTALKQDTARQNLKAWSLNINLEWVKRVERPLNQQKKHTVGYLWRLSLINVTAIANNNNNVYFWLQENVEWLGLVVVVIQPARTEFESDKRMDNLSYQTPLVFSATSLGPSNNYCYVTHMTDMTA